MKPPDHKTYSPDYLFHVAQGFYDIGINLATRIKDDKTAKGFQGIAPAVVNLSFSIELMIKGLHLITTKKYIEGHRCWDLYKRLPDDIKSIVESKYNEFRLQKENKLPAYRIKVKRVEEDTSDDKSSDENLDLKELLIIHNSSFENWRYLFELRPEGYEYQYNFRLMNAFIKALATTINEKKVGIKPSMILQKNKNS